RSTPSPRHANMLAGAEALARMSDSLVGKQVDDYVVTELIGDGASGWVYSARHARTERPVAIKVLRRELSSSEKITQRFLTEARTINAVGHPNIVEVLGSGIYDARHYMVLELLQ